MKKLGRWVRLLLALCLALMPLNAFAATGDAAILRRDDADFSDYVENMSPLGDKLCLMGGEALYLYGVGDAAPAVYPWSFGEDEQAQAMKDAGSGLVAIDGENIVMLRHVMAESDGQSTYAYSLMGDVALEEGRAVVSNPRQVTWPDALLAHYDDSDYPVSCGGWFAANGVLYVLAYADQGTEVSAVALDTMKCTAVPLKDPVMIVPDGNGRVLAMCEDDRGMSLCAYDPAGGQVENLCRFADGLYELSGLACDPDTGACYVVCDGQVCPVDLQTGALGDAVASMPLTGESQSGCVFGGGYYAYRTYQATVIRSLNPEAMPSQSLKVYDGMWLSGVTEASLDFTDAHDDVAVTVSHDFTEQEQLLQNMMNQSSDVDVYILSATNGQYAAMHQRSYMPEIASETLRNLAEQMYPAIQETILRDGMLTEFPVGAFSWRIGVSERALARLDMKMEDIPSNWSDFLDFLNTLPPRLEGTGVSAFEDYYNQRELRDQLFFALISDYQSYAERAMDVPSYDTPQLRTLLEKLDRVDFEGLGYPAMEEDEDEEHASYAVVSVGPGNDEALFNSSAGAAFGLFSGGVTPLLLGIDESDEVPLDLTLTVAFLNPYSKNLPLATEFLEQLVENLPETEMYNFIPALTEPLKGRYYDEGLQNYQEICESLQKKYDEADEADRQALQPEMEAAQEELENYSVNGMAVSQAQVDWFRSHDDCLTVRGEDWLFSDNGEAYDLMQQYLSKKIGADELLSGIDQKIQMMIMEGR